MARPKGDPSYLLHRGSGQARTIIDGKTIYLGPFNSPESEQKFREVVSEWRLRQSIEPFRMLVEELAARFLEFANGYYRDRRGVPTRAADNFKHAFRPLVERHGRTRVRDFGPKCLKEVRESMVSLGHSRNYVNDCVSKIKQLFRWGCEEELLPSHVYEAVRVVKALQEGRTKARETSPVLAVSVEKVELTLPHLPSVIEDMVRLQLLTGARPCEVRLIRPVDIERLDSGTWCYRPSQHKTERHGKSRLIAIGPQGQQILQPYLDRDPEAFCFSPKESETRRSLRRRRERQSAVTPSQANRASGRRTYADKYTRNTYAKAVSRACESAFGMPFELRYINRHIKKLTHLSDEEKQVERTRLCRLAAEWRDQHCWSPNQLRHTRATFLRQTFGIEAAQTVLGHENPNTTLIYAERDFRKASEIMAEVG